MDKTDWYDGICTTCDNRGSCTYIKAFGPPRFYCDEHEGILASLVEPTNVLAPMKVKAAVSPRTPPPEPEGTSARYKGLCSNCENRESCTFPKPEGGVWQCEEYC